MLTAFEIWSSKKTGYIMSNSRACDFYIILIIKKIKNTFIKEFMIEETKVKTQRWKSNNLPLMKNELRRYEESMPSHCHSKSNLWKVRVHQHPMLISLRPLLLQFCVEAHFTMNAWNSNSNSLQIIKPYVHDRPMSSFHKLRSNCSNFEGWLDKEIWI